MQESLPTLCSFCDATFGTSQGLTKHQKKCKLRKQRISTLQNTARINIQDGRAGALRDVEERAAKRQRVDDDPGYNQFEEMAEGGAQSAISIEEAPAHTVVDNNERPRRRRITRPRRYKDFIATSFCGLPPETDIPEPDVLLEQTDTTASTTGSLDPNNAASRLVPAERRGSPERRKLVSDPNEFGLYRIYWANAFPSHDPDSIFFSSAETQSDDEDSSSGDDSSSFTNGLASIGQDQQVESAESPPVSYYPYPNESSFRLGNWFWTDSGQKTHSNFQNLVDIVSDDQFCSKEVRECNWARVNNVLATGNRDSNLDSLCDSSQRHQNTLNMVPTDKVASTELWEDEVGDGWKCTPVTIQVPFHSKTAEPGVHSFTSYPGFYHRSIIDIVKEKVTDQDDFSQFHLEPYELHWQPRGASQSQRVQGELYTSPAFIQAHKDLHESPREPGCDLERVVFGLIFGSDESRLASFGNAKLWPGYVWAGNDSKYRLARPTSHLAHHFAYFEKLPDSFKDFYTEKSGGKKPSDPLLTHCHREFFHAQWREILDDDFVEAYVHGVVILCADGVWRRFYIRIFIYSADYPEKILIAGIRNLGTFLCPRCHVHKQAVRFVGSQQDRHLRLTETRTTDEAYGKLIAEARRLIYKKNYAVNSDRVEAILKDKSLVPTLNAFYDRLLVAKFDVFKVLTVDFLHEIELGVWKALFIHLLRILQSIDSGLLLELNKRFRLIPTFGRDTIRKFSSDVSGMKQLAARDFEDILQCALPVFGGLIPGENGKSIQKLLFVFAHWHALAKLRLHHEKMLQILDGLTTRLGADLRIFESDICPQYRTKELPREAAARSRRQARQKQQSDKRAEDSLPGPSDGEGLTARDGTDGVGATSNDTSTKSKAGKESRRERKFSLEAYKPHALGDYVSTIKLFGTTDSMSTQIGELAHKTPKASYKRTSKKAYTKQLSRIERIQATLRRMDRKYRRRVLCKRNKRRRHDIGAKDLNLHHYISRSQNKGTNIGFFLRTFSGDPATENFYEKLKRHLLPRIKSQIAEEIEENRRRSVPLKPIRDETSTSDSQNQLFIRDNMMYPHKLLRINYTSYDVRRLQDIVHPGTSHSDIMLLSSDNDETSYAQHGTAKPLFIFARVLGVYHVNVIYTGPGSFDYNSRRIEFLHVRWFAHLEEEAGWDVCMLDRLSFPPIDDPDSFGFVDPADVVRACHIIPDFGSGKPLRSRGIEQTVIPALLLSGYNRGSLTRSKLAQDGDDWAAYYHNRFVDRDMVMRLYPGLAVGHLYAFESGSSLENLEIASNGDFNSGEFEDPELLNPSIDGEDDECAEWMLGDLDEDNWAGELSDYDAEDMASDDSYDSDDED